MRQPGSRLDSMEELQVEELRLEKFILHMIINTCYGVAEITS